VTYAVKEIYYTLQGEGANVGRPAVFLRFTGCNLWSGLEKDRSKGPGGCSQWCDTDFVGTDGTGGGRFRSPESLADAVVAQWPVGASKDTALVVCTGGEPLLQLNEPLIAALHARQFYVAVETNGTVEPPTSVDWLTVSPKANAILRATKGDELKLVYPQMGLPPEGFAHMGFGHFFLQPLDGPERDTNTKLAISYCLTHPKWRLSVQTHKVIGMR
jgi:7-carboxy-7-deazaguanine synthase (Cx14CxxC type)